MKTRVANLVIRILFILTLSWSLVDAQSRPPIVFVHANVIPMNKEIVLSDYSVVIMEGRIK